MSVRKSATVQSASFTTVEDALTVNCANCTDLGIQVTGTWAGTITFEASIDGTNWTAAAVKPVGATTATTHVTSTTAVGMWSVDVAAFRSFRARYSTDTSGTAVVAAIKSTRGGLAG